MSKLMSKNKYIPELTEDQEKEIGWTKEKIKSVPAKKWIYKIACLFLGKNNLTYQEMFLLLYGIYNGKVGSKKAKEIATDRIIAIYEFNNNRLPDGVEKYGA